VVDEAEKGRRYGVRVDPTARRVDVLLRVDPGLPCVYGAVQIQGLQGLPEDRIRDTINLRPGARYSTADLEEARHALLALNVFSSVEYEADLGRGSERPRVIPVTFRLAPAPLHTTSLGGGVRADTVQSDVHAVMGYEHGNFLGGLRRLTLQARPGVVLYPITTSNLQPLPTKLLFQMQAKAELRQPSFLEARTNGTLRLEGVLRPFILPSAAGKELEQVLGFYEFRGTLGLDRAFFDNRLVLGVSSNAQISVPFAYCKFVNIFCRREAVDELSPLVVTYVAATQAIDLRDDAIRPRRGVYLLNEVQVALGKVNDVRVQPDLRTYLPLSRRATLATRASVGFLLPSFGSYGGTYDGGEVSVRDLQLLFLRGFFSGGPNSNRGYPTAGVGQLDVPTKTLGQFLVGEDCYEPDAGGTAQQPRPPSFVPSQRCYLPLGGLSTWEASIELRVQLSDTVSLVPFADASDVTRKRGRLRLTQPHPSTGLGLRYDTPIGPLRLDVGYAVPRTAFGVNTANEWGVEPNFLGLGLPVAFNIAFGEAF
jgi:outer membrane protein insertion porin family/translocation and assembly module TamA